MTVKDHPKEKNYDWTIIISLGLLILIAAASILPIPKLWGINIFKFYSPYIAYLLITIALIFTVPPLARSVETSLAIVSKFSLHGSAKWLGSAIALLLFAIMFFALSTKTTYLGDGQLRINQLESGQWWLPTSLGDFFLHAALYKFIFQPLHFTAQNCYQFFSIVCGIIFIIGSWRLAVFLYPDRRLIPFLIFISSGILAQFFGYVESYSLLAAILPFLIISGVKAYERPANLYKFIILFIMACLIHPMAFFLFAPAVVLLMVIRLGGEKISGFNGSKLLLSVISILIVIAYLARSLGVAGISQYLVPIISAKDAPPPLLSATHWIDLFNWLVFSALPIFILLPLILPKLKTFNFYGRGLFSIWTIISSLIFIIFYSPQLGAPRDWDLFSLPVFVILLSSVVCYSATNRKKFPAAVVPSIVMSAFLTFAFVGINSSVIKATNRFAEVIEISKYKNLYREYDLLGFQAYKIPELRSRWIEFELKAWAQPPYTKTDSVLILNRLGDFYSKVGDTLKAIRFLNLSLKADSAELRSYQYLIDYYNEYGTPEDKRRLAEKMMRIFADDASGLSNAGSLFCQLGDMADGSFCMEKAFNLDSNDLTVEINYGTYQIGRGNFLRAVNVLRRALNKSPNHFQVNLMLGLAYSGIGDTTMAEGFFKSAGRLATNPAESSLVTKAMTQPER